MKAEELHDRRIAARLTQKQLSRISGVPQNTISKIENARVTASPLTLSKLEDALSTERRELLEAARYAERYLTEHPPPDAGPLYQITLEVLRTAIRRNQ